jgi:hypothetical protein
MKIKDSHTDADRPLVQSEADLDASAAARLSRRRTLLAGLAATPVVLTIFGRSAFAQPINCSVAQSVIAGTSLHPGITPQAAADAAKNNNCPM